MTKKKRASILNKLFSIPNAVLIGVVSIVFVYVGVAGVVSGAFPWWFGAGDTPPHIDYVWNIHNRALPQFDQGITYEPIQEVIEESGRKAYFVQSSSQHPPLFYVVHAFVIGEQLEKGEWHSAIALGRVVNIFFGVLAILALAWAGWVFGGKRKEIFAISVPALGVLTNPFVTFNISFSGDALLVFFSAIGITSAYKIYKEGLSRKYLTILTIASILGMLTKVTYIIVLGVALLFVFLAPLMKSGRITAENITKGLLISAGIFLVIVISTGWFYYLQNYQATGDWTRSGSQDWISYSRPYKSLKDVLFGRDLVTLFPAKLFADKTLSLVISFALSVGGLYWVLRNRLVSFLRHNIKTFIAVCLMVLLVILAYATQVVHAVGYGGFYFRYLMPALVPLALAMSYGALGFKSLRGALVALVPTIMAYTTLEAVSKSSLITDTVDTIEPSMNMMDRLVVFFEFNQVWGGYVWILLAFVLAGLMLLYVSLWRTTARLRE